MKKQHTQLLKSNCVHFICVVVNEIKEKIDQKPNKPKREIIFYPSRVSIHAIIRKKEFFTSKIDDC